MIGLTWETLACCISLPPLRLELLRSCWQARGPGMIKAALTPDQQL